MTTELHCSLHMLVITELEFLFFKQKLKSIATAALLIFPNFTIILNALSNLLLEEKKKATLQSTCLWRDQILANQTFALFRNCLGRKNNILRSCWHGHCNHSPWLLGTDKMNTEGTSHSFGSLHPFHCQFLCKELLLVGWVLWYFGGVVCFVFKY